MLTTVTLERLKKRGYEPLLEHYLKVSPQLNEPLYTRPAWFILSEVEGYSGVRGAPLEFDTLLPFSCLKRSTSKGFTFSFEKIVGRKLFVKLALSLYFCGLWLFYVRR